MLSIDALKVNRPGGNLVKRRMLRWLSFAACALMLVCAAVWAQNDQASEAAKPSELPEAAAKLFHLKVPTGFEVQTSDEPGIFKWKKGPAEIYLAVGDLFALPAQTVYKQLLEAVEQNKDLEKVRTLKIKGGRSFTYTEKAPEEPGRLRTLHLVVITNEKVINVDFSAPAKDFDPLVPDFEAAIKSFRLVSSKS
jgi:hypothetical protein